MKASLLSLNNILYEQIERLNDDDLTGQSLDEQIKKTREIHRVASVIIDNTALMLEGVKFVHEDMLACPEPVMKAIGFDSKNI